MITDVEAAYAHELPFIVEHAENWCGMLSMALYQLYFFDSHHYLGSASVEAGNDLQAERLARKMGGNAGVELWLCDRKVRSIAGANRKLLSPPAPPGLPTPA